MKQFKGAYPISGEDLSALPVREIGPAVKFYASSVSGSHVAARLKVLACPGRIPAACAADGFRVRCCSRYGCAVCRDGQATPRLEGQVNGRFQPLIRVRSERR